MEKISVIIPVYNAEKYISRCISSIINQTYKHLEIIAINDCSQDNSLALLNKFAQKDERIIIISHDVNRGEGWSRHAGLENSTGTYLTFVDADDWLALNAIELLVNKIKAENADMVTGAMVRVMDKYGLIRSAPKNNYSANMLTASIEQPELFEKYFISFFGVNYIFVSACSKLYKKEIFTRANYTSHGFKTGEDMLLSMCVHLYLNKIAFIKQVVYYYRFGGITSKSNPYYLKDIKRQYRVKENIIRQYDYTRALPYIKYELVNCFYLHALNLLLKDNFSKADIRRFVVQELRDEVYLEATSDIDLDEKRKAIKEQDIDKVINILIKERKKERITYRIKRIIFRLLN